MPNLSNYPEAAAKLAAFAEQPPVEEESTDLPVEDGPTDPTAATAPAPPVGPLDVQRVMQVVETWSQAHRMGPFAKEEALAHDSARRLGGCIGEIRRVVVAVDQGRRLVRLEMDLTDGPGDNPPLKGKFVALSVPTNDPLDIDAVVGSALDAMLRATRTGAQEHHDEVDAMHVADSASFQTVMERSWP